MWGQDDRDEQMVREQQAEKHLILLSMTLGVQKVTAN